MGRPGAADEPHGAGAGAVQRRSLFLSFNDLRPQRHPQVAVGIHAQERPALFPFDEIARAMAGACANHAGDHSLLSLKAAAPLHLLQARREYARQPIDRHKTSFLLIGPAAESLARSRTSMSTVIAARSNCGAKPQSSRAAAVSSEWGHDSAMH